MSPIAKDYDKFIYSINTGTYEGTKNVYLKAIDYKSLEAIRVCPVYKENAVLSSARLYGGKADEVTPGNTGTPTVTKNYINNTHMGMTLKYENVDFVSDIDTIRWNTATTKAWAPLQAEVYLDSLDSTPIATIDIVSTGKWDTFVTQERKLSDELHIKGVHDVYIKFITNNKTCNFHWIDFVCR